MEKNNNDDLPQGFEYIEAPPKITIRFDPDYKRLYLSKHIFNENLLRIGQSVGIAYNKQTDELLIDKHGTGFRVSVSGYIITKHLFEFFLRRCKELNADKLNYELDYSKMDNDRFLLFKLI